MESEAVAATHARRLGDWLLVVPALLVASPIALLAFIAWQGSRPDYGSSFGAGVALIVLGPWALLFFALGFVWLAAALFARGRGARGWVSVVLRIAVSVLALALIKLGSGEAWTLRQDAAGAPVLLFAGAAVLGLLGFIPVIRSLRPAK